MTARRCSTATCPNDPIELIPVLGQLERGTPVAFEAAYGWGWLADLLEELGLEPHLVHPSGCKAIAAARLKDDRVDDRTLAHLLRADPLPEAWIAPQAVRDQRALLRHRAGLVRLRTILKNRVHAVLADRGVQLAQPLWTKAGRAWLDGLVLPAAPRGIVTDCCGLVDQLAPIIARLERDLLAHAKPDPRVAALMALPGVGPITAMTLVAEIGDIGRFATARKLSAWAGLTPQVHNLRLHGPSRSHHQDGMWDLPGTAVAGLRYGSPALEVLWPVRCRSSRRSHGHRRRVGTAPWAADLRLPGSRHRGGDHRPDRPRRPRPPACLAGALRRRAAGGLRAGGLHRLAVRRRGTGAGRDRRARGRAGRDRRPARSQAARQDRPSRRPASA
jgi:transposase